MRQRGDVLSGGSYLSSNDMRVHFGLGDSVQAGKTIKLPAVDRIYTIVEGKGITGAACGNDPCPAAATPATTAQKKE
jgi:hypothetical protein